MKYLHVLTPNSVHPQNIIKFINKNFDKEDHTFLVLADENYVLKNNPRLYAFDNVIFSPSINKTKFSRFKRMMFMMGLFRKYDNIIWHSFYGLTGLQMLFAVFQYRHKITWIEYGNDLYYWKQKSKKWIEMFLYEKICKECKCFGASIENNTSYYINYLNKNARTFFLPVPFNGEIVESLKKYTSLRKNSIKNTQIIIGTDGNRYNCHYKIINILKKYCDYHFSCFIPVNFSIPYEYGILLTGKNYISNVIEYGHRILKNPVIKLHNVNTDIDNYLKILNNADIGVFYFGRPIYLDILLCLLYLEKKVYLPRNSVIYNNLINIGFVVYDTLSISQMEYKDFINCANLSSNRKLAEKYMSTEYIKYYWEIYFNYLEKEK